MKNIFRTMMGLLMILAGLGVLGFVIFKLVTGGIHWGSAIMWGAVAVHAALGFLGAGFLYNLSRGADRA